MKIKYLFSIILLLLVSSLQSQNYDWWHETHNWDGKTHWTNYLKVSPGFFGPNALPVPEVNNGILTDKYRFDFAVEHHHGQGDKTQNVFTQLYIPIAENKVGFNVSLVPIERYEMDTETRDERAARDFDGKGYAGGDFYVSTFIQLMKDHRSLPDLLLSINLKTASGTNLEGARFTDTPGYYFDLSFGKQYQSIRLYGMLGLYVWQTFEDLNPQNDAFLFGGGGQWSAGNYLLNAQVGGYLGYKKNGDKPIVARLNFQSNHEGSINYFLRLQKGFQDFYYTSVRLGLSWHFINHKKPNVG